MSDLKLGKGVGVGGVVMLVGDMVVGLRHMHCGNWGYMELGYSIGGLQSCW